MDSNLQAYFDTKDIQSLHAWVSDNYTMFRDIVAKTIKRHNLYTVDPDDMFSEAIIAFYGIVDTYDPAISQFSTYIYKTIENELLNKIKTERVHDFQRRVSIVELDEVVESDNGKTALREESVSATDPEAIMRSVMVTELREYVETHLSPKKREIYKLYSNGMNIPMVADKLGVSKQYVSKVLSDLIQEVRKEWQVNEWC